MTTSGRLCAALLAVAAGTSLALAQPTPAMTPPAAEPAAPTTPRPPSPIPAGEGPAVTKVSKALSGYENRLIRSVELRGLRAVAPQLVLNQVRSVEGSPLSEAAVRADVARLNRLGRFNQIEALATLFDDGTVGLVYEFIETPIVRAARAVGNRQISDEDLATEIDLLAGTPIDRFQIDRLVRRIKDLYRKRGYYQADVTVDEAELSERGNLIFQIREGERLKVTDIRFDGNGSFDASQLRPQIKTETWGIFSSGALDDSVIDQDVAAIIQFYKDRGHLDVRVDRTIRPSPNGQEAILTFIISEGQVYTLRSVRVALAQPGTRDVPSDLSPRVYSREQIAGLMTIKAGDVYSLDRIRKSIETVQDAYGKLGYVDSTVAREEIRDVNRPEVDILLIISEGEPSLTGLVTVRGNELTQQKVIRRQVKLLPDRPLDTTFIKRTKESLDETQLFEQQSVKLTIQPPDPSNPAHRDLLVEIKETNTGRLGFGAAVNTDLGLIGTIDFAQRNFDISDTPDSMGELLTGRAFRGAGQSFAIQLQPGTNFQNYSISLGEPNLFETDYAANVGTGFRRWDYDEYTETRISLSGTIGRRFGERWAGGISGRVEQVTLGNFQSGTTVDLRNVEGSNFLAGVSARIARTATDSNIRPTRGTKFDASIERVGGDFSFWKMAANFGAYLPLYEDFSGRTTVLTFRSSVGLIPEDQDDVPLFERFYSGGTAFRGFSFRGISPRGIIAGTNPPVVGADPVGGTWSLFNGLQVEQPVWRDVISVVGFIDSGTVNASRFNVSQYRVAVGAGFRLYLPMLGPNPLAFDFAVPLRREEFDEKRIFSFTLDVPF
ncbi:MAG: outer membrane protein assembly factor BamA [Phycisphaerales bacterium]|nr:outer membrane protein assembly factor BamA [Phycisphaerales bacterium]